MSKNELAVTENTYAVSTDIMDEEFMAELDGMTQTFDRVRIPSGGGLAFEVPGDDPDSPDMVKEFKAVILHHHPINVFYKDKFDGSSNPPDCGSVDGKIGINNETGEVLQCAKCENSRFGSADDGKGKACKQKRRIYIQREGDIFPCLMTLPTGSLKEFNMYIRRLLNKAKKSNQVVTKFTLRKAQNTTGINYSQAVFSEDRDLSAAEMETIKVKSQQAKAFVESSELDAE